MGKKGKKAEALLYMKEAQIWFFVTRTAENDEAYTVYCCLTVQHILYYHLFCFKTFLWQYINLYSKIRQILLEARVFSKI